MKWNIHILKLSMLISNRFSTNEKVMRASKMNGCLPLPSIRKMDWWIWWAAEASVPENGSGYRAEVLLFWLAPLYYRNNSLILIGIQIFSPLINKRSSGMLYAIHFSLCLGYIAGMQCVVFCQMAGLASAKLLSGHLTTTFQEAMLHFFLRFYTRREMAAKAYSVVFSPVQTVTCHSLATTCCSFST